MSHVRPGGGRERSRSPPPPGIGKTEDGLREGRRYPGRSMIMDDRCMYDDDKKTKGKAMAGYGQERTVEYGFRRSASVGMTDVGYRDFTVSCSYRHVVWVSTLRCGGLPEWKKSPKVFS